MHLAQKDSVLSLAILIIIIIAWMSLTKPKRIVNYELYSPIPESVINHSPTVIIDTTHTGLVIYYPPVDSINLRCLERPDPVKDEEIVFCCAGAYTGTREKGHSNIAGDHVSSGRRFKGYKCTRNTGCFVFYNGKWKFLYEVYSNELDSAAAHNGAGYAQEMLIHNGKSLKTARPDNNVNLFRALCERGGKLCVADATDKMAFGDFKQLLLDAGIKEALYTDMGHGWNYSWYREYADSNAIFIHKEYQEAATNWIVFYASK